MMEVEETPPPLDPKMFVHLMAVQSVLEDWEAKELREALAGMGPWSFRLVLKALARLSIPDAVGHVRRNILGL